MKIFFDGGCRPNPGAMEVAAVARGKVYRGTGLGEWTCRSAELRPYLARFREQAPHFRRLRVRHIRRAQNLAGIALERARAYESESSKF